MRLFSKSRFPVFSPILLVVAAASLSACSNAKVEVFGLDGAPVAEPTITVPTTPPIQTFRPGLATSAGHGWSHGGGISARLSISMSSSQGSGGGLVLRNASIRSAR